MRRTVKDKLTKEVDLETLTDDEMKLFRFITETNQVLRLRHYKFIEEKLNMDIDSVFALEDEELNAKDNAKFVDKMKKLFGIYVEQRQIAEGE